MENENKSIVPVKPSDNTIVSISNQISLTNKLLANIESDKKELTHLTGLVTDIDGNVYHTIKIGNQWWMVENLKTSRFRDGSMITESKDNISWKFAGYSNTAAWCYYDNNAKNNPTYGKLYNWHTVADPRGLCPVGWHVPSHEEFRILVDYLGEADVEGDKMKVRTSWDSPNTGALNPSGFIGLPAGSRANLGHFYNLGSNGIFWSSTEGAHSPNTFVRTLYNNDSKVINNNHECPKGFGLSVRCVKD